MFFEKVINKLIDFWRKHVNLITVGAIISIPFGWLLNAYAWCCGPPHPVGSIYLLLGLFLFCGGIFILGIRVLILFSNK